MSGPVVVDANLLTLLIVGTTSVDYIESHKRLAADFVADHFRLLVELIGLFSEIILLPHIIAETSSIVRQVRNPMRSRIQNTLKKLIETTTEFPVASVYGAQRGEYQLLGITHAVILHLLSMNEITPTLMTIDGDLINRAESLGYRVLDCRREFWPERE
jgi:hypothetical protein